MKKKLLSILKKNLYLVVACTLVFVLASSVVVSAAFLSPISGKGEVLEPFVPVGLGDPTKIIPVEPGNKFEIAGYVENIGNLTHGARFYAYAYYDYYRALGIEAEATRGVEPTQKIVAQREIIDTSVPTTRAGGTPTFTVTIMVDQDGTGPGDYTVYNYGPVFNVLSKAKIFVKAIVEISHAAYPGNVGLQIVPERLAPTS